MADSKQADERFKRKKTSYGQGQNKRKAYGKELCPGSRGVIVTCNFEERRGLSEAYNLLNEYGTRLYGPEKMHGDNGDGNSASDDEDVEAALRKEVAALKETKPDHRRFQSIHSGAKNVLFVRCSKEIDSVRLVHYMLEDVLATRTAKARFAQRFIPVSDVAYASVASITEQAKRVLAPHFHKPACETVRTFAVVFKCRNNGDMNRDEIIKVVADVAVSGGVTHKVNLSSPELVISVEIIKANCCMSVVTDFYKLKRYNIHAIVNEGRAAEGKPEQTGQEAAAVQANPDDVSKPEPSGEEAAAQPESDASKPEPSGEEAAVQPESEDKPS